MRMIFNFYDGRKIEVCAKNVYNCVSVFKDDYHTYIPVDKIKTITVDDGEFSFEKCYKNEGVNLDKVNAFVKSYRVFTENLLSEYNHKE